MVKFFACLGLFDSGQDGWMIGTHLKLICFLKLVGVLILAIIHLLSLDVGIHPMFLNISSRQIKVSISFVVRL